MKKQLSAVAVAAALLKINLAAAAPFNSFDPRSMAMGGAGVAVGNTASAPFFNPSLLATTNSDDDFAMEFPVAGVRAYDPNDFAGSLDDFQNADLVGQIDADIANTSTNYNSASYRQVAADATQLATDPNVGFPTISDKAVQADFGAGTVIGIPSKRFGAAFVANATATFSGRAHYTPEDQQALVDLANDVNSYATCLDTVGCNPATQTYTYIDPLTGQINFNTSNLTSSGEIRGLMLAEVGLSFAHEFTIFGAPLSLGITPKYVMARTFDYVADVNDMKSGDVQEDQYTHDQSNFNLDIGASRDFQNGWRGGLVVKNLVPQVYDYVYTDPITGLETKTGSLNLNPQARAGVSYQDSWFTAALDVDLTENDPVGFENKTRYVALGTELDAYDWAQLRLGYRADMLNSDRNIVSAGLGLSPFGAHVDMAVAGNAHEIGASIQLGYRF